MDLGKMIGGAQQLTDSVNQGVGKVLDEFNAALPTMRALGFNVEDLKVKMGLPPEISAKLTATAADVDVNELNKLIQKNSENKTLVTVLKGLLTAYNIRDQLGDLGLKGIEVNITLGLLPNIGIGFIKSAATPVAAKSTASA
jgi:predicted regulator of amino acid metabolism with ACT domain